jgi:hypothetical protein
MIKETNPNLAVLVLLLSANHALTSQRKGAVVGERRQSG